MGFRLLIGCLLIAYAVPLTVLVLLIRQRAQLIIIAIAAAFVWLIQMLLCAGLWVAIPPLQDSLGFVVMVGVTAQETTRYLFFNYYAKGEMHIAATVSAADEFPLTDIYTAVAAGTGTGALHTLLHYGALLPQSLESGQIFTDKCSPLSLVVLSAWMALAYNCFHLCFMLIGFDAYRHRSTFKIAVLWLLHYCVSLLSLGSTVENGCTWVLPLEMLLVVAIGVYTIRMCNAPGYQSKLD